MNRIENHDDVLTTDIAHLSEKILSVFPELEPFRRFVDPACEGEARCEPGMAQNN